MTFIMTLVVIYLHRTVRRVARYIPAGLHFFVASRQGCGKPLAGRHARDARVDTQVSTLSTGRRYQVSKIDWLVGNLEVVEASQSKTDTWYRLPVYLPQGCRTSPWGEPNLTSKECPLYVKDSAIGTAAAEGERLLTSRGYVTILKDEL